ncbi:MerR family transcriptional regulator [Nocardia alni]|uniref:MerR family transcriptional regulator n=1 Tax=Nocardia alni TaxID=2815723 RepID=UPI0020B22EC5|nr:MerR family transcriptional regulator [Nocardia alni]
MSIAASHMTIGELSRRTNISVKALREYTDLGLIHTLGRSPAGYHLYDTEALLCVRSIVGLRDLGLTVAEICRLTGGDGGGRTIGQRLAELLDRSRRRPHRRVIEYQQILDPVDDFEYRYDFAGPGDLRCVDRCSRGM